MAGVVCFSLPAVVQPSNTAPALSSSGPQVVAQQSSCHYGTHLPSAPDLGKVRRHYYFCQHHHCVCVAAIAAVRWSHSRNTERISWQQLPTNDIRAFKTVYY